MNVPLVIPFFVIQVALLRRKLSLHYLACARSSMSSMTALQILEINAGPS